MWLDWWACQLDTLHWWEELTAIPDVEDLRRLAWKICVSFFIPVVRCETLLSQDYTMPPAPKCLTRGRFLPNHPIYQDVQWQLLLLTLAYAWALQYWVEKVRLLMPGDYCPLMMSIMELKWWVEGHITFSKQDIFYNLESTAPEARAGMQRSHKRVPLPHMPLLTLEAWSPHSTETLGADDTILVSPGCTPRDETPPAEPTILPAEANAEDTLPDSAETPPGGNTMVLLAEVNTETPKDLSTDWATSPAEVERWVVPATGLVDKLADPHPVWPRKTVHVDLDHFWRGLNLEATGVTPRDIVIVSVGRVALGNPHMAATLKGPPKERKAVCHQDAIADELAEKDLAEGHL